MKCLISDFALSGSYRWSNTSGSCAQEWNICCEYLRSCTSGQVCTATAPAWVCMTCLSAWSSRPVSNTHKLQSESSCHWQQKLGMWYCCVLRGTKGRFSRTGWNMQAFPHPSNSCLWIGMPSYIERREHLETAVCGGLLFSVELLLSILALNGKKASLHSLAFHSELFLAHSEAGRYGN